MVATPVTIVVTLDRERLFRQDGDCLGSGGCCFAEGIDRVYHKVISQTGTSRGGSGGGEAAEKVAAEKR
jgi:hypothetical protein